MVFCKDVLMQNFPNCTGVYVLATYIVLLTQNRHSVMRPELPDYFYLDILKTVKEEKLYAFDEHVSVGTLDIVHCQDENETARDSSVGDFRCFVLFLYLMDA